MLLTRDKFRNAVFERDSHNCVWCKFKHDSKVEAQDAHHLIERRLFTDGGYYLDNGVSLCGDCHLKAESTEISVEDLRHAAGITTKVLPNHLYIDQEYDKWGNPILPNGERVKGELFEDESVQKILDYGNMLSLFTDYVKYPRTFHLPWSPGVSDDDRIIDTLYYLKNKRVIVTEKMDGENTSMYSDHIHARSVENRTHASRDWIKGNVWARIMGDIPKGWRICGENLYAQHSIRYDELESYFYGFSIWNDKNECLSWDETLEWFSLLDIVHVPIIYDGIFDELKIKELWDRSQYNTCEGYVVRVAGSFDYSEFKNKVAKFVRSDHVQTTKHWMYGQKIEPNKLK